MKSILRGAIVFLVAGWLAYSFSTEPPRGLRSLVASEGPGSKADLNASVEELLNFVRSDRLTAENCGPVLNDVYARAFDIKPAQLEARSLRGSSGRIIENLFLVRRLLRDRLTEFDRELKANESCVSAVRDTLRAARVIEDYVAEWHSEYPVNDPQAPVGAFNGSFPWIQTHPDHKQIQFRSGDVFISRGTAFTSAAISRITDDDANFSHLAILYVDEKTGEKWMVEAHIEVGSIVTRFDDYRFDGKARAVQLRFHDGDLAHRAAKLIHDRVKVASDSGENICYDFAMDMADRNCLFCSEVVSVAFAIGSSERVQVPRFPSTITMKNRDFVSRLGVAATRTFAPADIELDGRFKVVAEWRDLGKVNLLHEYDAILTSIFLWMERENYVMRNTFSTGVRSRVFHSVRRWPLFGGLLKEKFPKNMPRSALAAVMTLDAVGEQLLERLHAKNLDSRKTSGFWLTPGQMLAELELYRKEDLDRVAAGKKPHFHHLLSKKR